MDMVVDEARHQGAAEPVNNVGARISGLAGADRRYRVAAHQHIGRCAESSAADVKDANIAE